jgi:putative phosphoribosyl transferase
MMGHDRAYRATSASALAAAEVQERVRRYRGVAEPVSLSGRTAIVVDDGLATGATARAALRAVRARGPARVVLAVPVAAPQSVESLRSEADEIVAVEQPGHMWAIGLWYEDFGQTPDAEVISLLRHARGPRTHVPEAAGAADDSDPPLRRAVTIPIDELGQLLQGDLVVPENATGLVVFAHGSGSSRHSPRNRHVAATLNRGGLATLLVDLLAPEEELDRRKVFDIPLLARRLAAVTRWSQGHPELTRLAIGYFGASTGAAAALQATADAYGTIRAVVSRGGRPDLAEPRLHAVTAPVLLIVGGHDSVVLELNREAQQRLAGPAELVVIPGATHLFEEPGALDEVAGLATDWFARHLRGT